MDGIVIAPEVDFGIAVVEDDPPPMLALLLATVYVQVMPSTISVYVVAAKQDTETINAAIEMILFSTFMMSS